MLLREVVISAQVHSFIFRYIDSVEQLEVLLLLSSDSTQVWSAEALSKHLRSSRTSVDQRLELLCNEGLVVCVNGSFQFAPTESSLVEIVEQVANVYKTHRHRLFELIFSPSKKARDFSEAFRMTSDKKKGDGDA